MANKKSSEAAPSEKTSRLTSRPSKSGRTFSSPTASSDSWYSGGTSFSTTSQIFPKRKTSSDELFGRKFKKRFVQYLAAIVVNMNVLPYGIALAWAGSVLPTLTSFDTPLSTGPITETDKTLLSACLPFMALLATPVFSVMCASVSRKIMGFAIAACQLASWMMFLVSDLHGLLYVGRLFVGIAAGGAFIQVPTYVSEIAEDDIRGALSCILLFAVNTGVLIEFILAATLSYQAQLVTYSFIPIIFIICNIFLPETPYFLLKQNKEEEAKESLKRLRAGHGSKEWVTLKAAFDSGAVERAKHPFQLIMASRGMKRGLIITVIAFISKQLSGIFAILSYSTQIFTEAEISMSLQTATIIVGLLQLLGTTLSVILVDRFGRRFLLILSGSGIVTSQGIIAIYFTLKNGGIDMSSASIIPLICLSTYMLIFSLGFSPLPFVLLSELLPHSVTSAAAALSLACLWTAATFITLAFNPLSLIIGVHSCFIIFTVCTFFATLFIILYLPETKGRPLSEITTNLEERSWLIFKKRPKEFTPSEAPTGSVNAAYN